MRQSKYPSIGLLDAISRLVYGFSLDISQQGLYEVLPDPPPRIEYSKRLYSLDHSGYVRRQGDKLGITRKGLRKVAIHRIQNISLAKKRDGKYRLIAFDIPEVMRQARDVIRSKLQSFECEKIQKSLYMTPYICEPEIAEVCRILKVERHVSVFKIDPSDFRISVDRRK